MNHKIFCNNCGKSGHNFRECVEPITSIGVIAFTYINGERNYLMIRRRDTLGFVDFMRGKYNVNNKKYLINIVNEMTITEKERIKQNSFEELWDSLWGDNISVKYMNEKVASNSKYDFLKNGITNDNENYNLDDIISCSNTSWEEQEWGFPKGRRNYKETDLMTGMREFCEETGINKRNVHIIKNLAPFEEIFTGSNYKSYKHKYYLAEIRNDLCLKNFEESEVSDVRLFNLDDCKAHIRDYNQEKLNLIQHIDKILNNYKIINLD